MRTSSLISIPVALMALAACTSDNPATPDNAERLAVAGVLEPVARAYYEYWPQALERANVSYVINSPEQLHDVFDDATLAESPDYAAVDFSRYTLIVQYHVLTAEIKNRRYLWYRYDNADIYGYELCMGYIHGDNLTHGAITVDRVAVIVDKLPADTHVRWAESIIEPW